MAKQIATMEIRIKKDESNQLVCEIYKKVSDGDLSKETLETKVPVGQDAVNIQAIWDSAQAAARVAENIA